MNEAGRITAEDGSSLTFDVVMEEQYGEKNAVTDHPVEDGTIYSDHIQRKPKTFTIVAIISETPFTDTPVAATRLQDAIDFLDRAGQGIVTYESTRFGLIEMLTLEAWEYTNDVFDRLEFTIGFKQIKIARAEIISVPRPAAPRARPRCICGNQPAKSEVKLTEPEAKQVVKETNDTGGSFLFNLLN